MAVTQTNNSNPEILVLMGPTCPYCAVVLNAFSALMQEGFIETFEAVNLDVRPEVAEEHGVRSVPWVRIGWFELEGARSKAELKQWIERSHSPEGAVAYFDEVLAVGQVHKVIAIIKKRPELLNIIIDMLSDADAKINVRLGLGVAIEEFAETGLLSKQISRLGKLLKHKDDRVRGDACHYLSLTGNREVIAYIEPLLEDESKEVREVAKDSLETLNS